MSDAFWVSLFGFIPVLIGIVITYRKAAQADRKAEQAEARAVAEAARIAREAVAEAARIAAAAKGEAVSLSVTESARVAMVIAGGTKE